MLLSLLQCIWWTLFPQNHEPPTTSSTELGNPGLWSGWGVSLLTHWLRHEGNERGSNIVTHCNCTKSFVVAGKASFKKKKCAWLTWKTARRSICLNWGGRCTQETASRALDHCLWGVLNRAQPRGVFHDQRIALISSLKLAEESVLQRNKQQY